MNETPRNILVVGGGYAGVLAASRVAGRLGARGRVTLLSDRDDLVHRVRLHEALAGREFARYPLRALLPPEVTVTEGRATRIDARERTVTTDRAGTLAFDLLLVTVGSALAVSVPGAKEHARWLASPETAHEGAARLRALPASSPVVVIGGGLTALEVASEIAEAHPRLFVSLLAPSLGAGLSPQGRAYARGALDALNVRVREGVTVREVRADEVVLRDGERVPAALSVWAGGFKAAGPAIESDLARDDVGRFVIDGDLRATGHERVFVAGDAAAPPPGMDFVRMSCASALPMGAHAADNLARVAQGQRTRPHGFGFFAQCISLGRERALVQSVHPDDRPKEAVLVGRPAVIVKELICRYVIGMLRVERLVAGAYQWPHSLHASLPEGRPAGALENGA